MRGRRLVAAIAILATGCRRHGPARPTSVARATNHPAVLEVAAAFATAACTTTPRADLATLHLRQVLPTIAGLPPDRRPVGTDVLDEQLVDPRSAQVVVQIDVRRTWLDGPTPAVDPSPHILLLTMVLEPDGRWLVDDALERT